MMNRPHSFSTLFCQVLKLAVVLLSLSGLLLPAQAEDFAPQIIRMGYTPSEGYLKELPFKAYEGLVYDYTEALSNYANLRIVYLPCKQDECYAMLQHGKLDVLANVPSHSSDSDPLLSFSRRSISSTVISLTRHKESSNNHSYDSTWRYGFDANVLPRRVINEALAEIGEEEGSSYVLIPYSQADKMLSDYQNSTIDGILYDSSLTPKDIKITDQLFRIKTYYAVKKGHEAYLKLLDDAADKLILSAPTFREALYENHLHNFQPLVLSEQEKLYLKNKKYFRVLVSPNQQPFSFFDDKGEYQGILKSIFSLVEEDLGIKFIYQQTVDYPEMLQVIQRGDTDLVGDCTYDYNWAKKHKLRLTIPYISADFLAVQKRGAVLPSKPKIACIEGAHYTEYVKDNITHEQIIYCHSYHDCLQAVNDGKADLTFVEVLNARHLIEDGDFFSLYTTGQIIFRHALSFALPQRTSALMIEILNKEVAHLKSQELLSIQMASSLNVKNRQSLKRLLHDNPVVFSLAALLIILLIGGLSFYFIHQQRIMAKKAWQVLHYDARTKQPNLRLFQEQLAEYLDSPKRMPGVTLYVLSINSKQFDLLRDAIDDEHMVNGIAQVLSELKKGPFLELFGIDTERQLIHCLCKVPTNMSFTELATLVRNRMASFSYSGYNLHLNPNIGAIKVNDDYTPKELITYADITLREAILHQKPTLLYEHDQFKNVVLYEKVEQLVNKALYNHEFEILIQPKYELKTHRCIGGEALVRWNSPELGHLTPDQFIEILEKNGLILELDYYMLDAVSELISTWIKKQQPFVPLSINHSGLHISEEGYLDKIRIICGKYMLPAHSLEIEITETAFVNYTSKSTREDAQELISKLHEMGFKLSLDDFCTGYSSISMLQSLHVDMLKIDRSVLVEAHKSERAAAVLRNVVRMGADLGCQALCEGIETEKDERLLLENGCLYGQGYLYGKPMRIPQFEEFIKEHL